MIRGPGAAVALLSAGSLAYEILLVRVFGIEQFHHIAYMAVSVAMLGVGASGTLVALVAAWPPERALAWWRRSAAVGAAALVAMPLAVRLVPLDLTQLPWDLSQVFRLGLVYALLALPFAATSLAILLALRLAPERTGRLYGASFAGAGMGALAAIGVLWLLSPVRALALPGLLGSAGALVATGITTAWPGLLAMATAGVALAVGSSTLQPRVNPYKGLPQVEAFPDARRVAERTSPVGWVVAVDAPAFRYAPGLSLGFTGTFPRQTAVFVDGEIAGAVTDWTTAPDGTALRWLPTALPYALAPGSVLVLGAGGGTEVEVALAHGASPVVAVELHPALVELAHESLGDSPVRFVAGDARAFVARSDQRFDLITLGPSGALGTTAAGVHALGEDFLHTSEAYESYLRHLTPHGVLAVTQWLRIPPRDNVRTILTAAAALRELRPLSLHRDLVVARSWGTATVLAKPEGFIPEEIVLLRRITGGLSFDLDWYPGIDTAALRPINALDEPVLTRAAAAALASPEEAERFARDYPFHVAPATDSRPYPHHFLDLRALSRLARADRGTWLPFVEWGYLALVATLAQSAVLAALCMIVPLVIARRREAGQPDRGRIAGYFGAIGLAYLAAEIAAIQQLQLLLGHPVYAVAVALAGLLIFSGAGSMWSDGVAPARGRALSFALAALLVAYAGILLPLIHALEPASLMVRAAAGLLLLAPFATLMGTPFPLGVRHLAPSGQRLAWAWAANGFASVVAAPLAALITVELGSPALFLLAAVGYGLAGILAKA